ncbi:uncharacterized protein LOC123533606 [Mercenaria mercenaria]|uniref:uncharacterized protein LOC123533606 n=1 Tax=Mercenaria mercenaria TaxID=6596 RepID=UPI00234EE978|nr:uncharacterized protein LOC123533606 [Mercenaria mercenaria]XP_053375527.1 uncharacterized protein LOC123533606 [Mercenaria mercenaria]XP_053375528.1 uncharacterized protein LOC123533606 [Mercenaria mercenaria]
MTTDSFELLPDSCQPPDRKCCDHLHKVLTIHPFLYGFVFISILVLDIAEVINDCFLFKDVSYLEEGLVYGPLSPTLVMILLLATAVGSLAIVFEILNITRDICSGKPWVDLDLDSALVVWLNEIPILSVNFAISLCHSEPVSYFQLTKCLIVILSVFLRIVVPLIRLYLAQDEDSSRKPFRKSIYKFVTNIGLCLALCGSVTIFIFTHVIALGEKQFKFRMPHEIWAGKSVFDEYFSDVGIYLHHRNLKSFKNDEIWLKLADIDEFYTIDSMNVKVTYTISYENKIEKLVMNSYNSSKERFRECYNLAESENGTLNYLYIGNCSFTYITSEENSEKLIFKFVFHRPQMHLLLGDISYKVKYLKNFVCYNVAGNDTFLYDNIGSKPTVLGQLLYMKQETRLHASHRLVHKNMSSNQSTSSLLYEADHYMKTADEIWKTGMYGCECTGKHGPTMDENITVMC